MCCILVAWLVHEANAWRSETGHQKKSGQSFDILIGISRLNAHRSVFFYLLASLNVSGLIDEVPYSI